MKVIWWTWAYPFGRIPYYYDGHRVSWNFGLFALDYAKGGAE